MEKCGNCLHFADKFNECILRFDNNKIYVSPTLPDDNTCMFYDVKVDYYDANEYHPITQTNYIINEQYKHYLDVKNITKTDTTIVDRTIIQNGNNSVYIENVNGSINL